MKRYLSTFLTALCLMVSAHIAVAQYAMPKVSVAIMRSEARHAAEQVSQVVMGTPLKVLSKQSDWWRIESPEGYTGYIRNNTLQGYTSAALESWKSSERGVVISDHTIYVYNLPDVNSQRVSDIVGGSILQIDSNSNSSESADSPLPTSSNEEMVAVTLPDGRKGYVESKYIMPIQQWAEQMWMPEKLPEYACRLMGTPYVWGGTSLKGMDCSGLTQISAYQQGIMLPRDASQQVNVGSAISITDYHQFRPGDLLFFGNKRTGRITHVAISMGGPTYIHCSARVRISSLAPTSPIYEDSGLLAARRIDSATAAGLSLRANPLYF